MRMSDFSVLCFQVDCPFCLQVRFEPCRTGKKRPYKNHHGMAIAHRERQAAALRLGSGPFYQVGLGWLYEAAFGEDIPQEHVEVWRQTVWSMRRLVREDKIEKEEF